MTRVAYLGPEGTFSEDAATEHFGAEGRLVSFPDIEAVISALRRGLVDAAVAPIENSIEGSVPATLDQLIHSASAPVITAELNLPIRHNLVVLPGTTMAQVQRLVAHPQSLGQCRRFVDRTLPQVQVLPALSNAAAVQALVHSTSLAAIGTTRAAELYGMEVLMAGIQDSDDNVTRFVVLGNETPGPTGRDKTSICCSISEDHPGSLVAILEEFSMRGINLTKIESRPTRQGLGSYFFLLDCQGHQRDPEVAAAIEGARRKSLALLLLGSYPAATVTQLAG
ncbi:MAG: prephenate dehydratase [Candidatus Dormibacteria bacterium]